MSAIKKRLPIVLCVALLATMFCLQLATALQESQTVDEGAHLSAGFSYWKTGDFRLNPEHPPLMKLLAAAPLLFTRAELPLQNAAWAEWNQWAFGDIFMYENTVPPATLLLLGRIPIMVLSLLLGWLIFYASRKLFGDWPAVFSLSLYVFDPGFIAHGHLVTTDLGFVAFGLWAIIRLSHFLNQPTNKNLLWFGLALWITGLAKFSIIPLLIAIAMTVLFLKLIFPLHPAISLKSWGKKMLLALPVLWLMTWAVYGFDIRRPNEDPRIAVLYEQREEFLKHGDISSVPDIEKYVINDLGDKQSAIGSWFVRASDWPVANYAWLRGWITVIGHSIGGQEAFLLGEYENFGWWYYFPIAVLIKTPLPTLAAMFGLGLIVFVSFIRKRNTDGGWHQLIERHQTWFVYISVPLVFFLFSLTSHLNLGWRHVMIIYPTLFILAGVFASPKIIKHRLARLVIPLTLGLGIIIVQIKTFPNELGYFNALIGGSANGPKYLLDSNNDWGQDLPKLEKFIEQNNITSIPFAYFGRPPAAEYLPIKPLPTTKDLIAQADIAAIGRNRLGVANTPELPTDLASRANFHGYAAISLMQLYRRDGIFDWLQQYQPVAILGSSIYVYHLP